MRFEIMSECACMLSRSRVYSGGRMVADGMGRPPQKWNLSNMTQLTRFFGLVLLAGGGWLVASIDLL
jgi:hypothetical protein